MALIKCPECGREISDKAAACPGCGYPLSKFREENHNDDEIDWEDIELVQDNYHCPRCGSDNVKFTELPAVIVTVPVFESSSYTTFTPGKTRAKCRVCGKKWKF